MKAEKIKPIAYATRLSFLGALSKHRGEKNFRVLSSKLSDSASFSLVSAFDLIVSSRLPGYDASKEREFFIRESGKYVKQLANELFVTMSKRNFSESSISFTGRVTDGRNKRLFEDMIALVASEAVNLAEISYAYELGKGSVEVRHNGRSEVYRAKTLNGLIDSVKSDGAYHPRTSASFSPYI